jgi:hypothetical protein
MFVVANMGVWQGVAMDSLKFLPSPLCPTPVGGPLQVGRPAAIFYPFGRLTPYAYGFTCEFLCFLCSGKSGVFGGGARSPFSADPRRAAEAPGRAAHIPKQAGKNLNGSRKLTAYLQEHSW